MKSKASERTPFETRASIMKAMADGRERTATDLQHRIGGGHQQITRNCGYLVSKGLLVSERILSGRLEATIYRKAGQ